MIDPEKTPADGVTALRRARESRPARAGAPLFVDFEAPLRHAEAVEEIRLCQRGSRLVTRVRIRHAVASPSSATVMWWAPGERAGAALIHGEVTGFDVTGDGRAIALWTLEKGYFNVIDPTSLRSATIGWRSPRIGRWGVRFDPREVRVAPDGQSIAVLGERGQLAVYRPVDALGPDWTMTEGARAIAWSPDGERLAVAETHELSVFDAASGERLWRVPRSSPNARGCLLAWAPDDRLLLLAETVLDLREGSLLDPRDPFRRRDDLEGAPELRSPEDGQLLAVLPFEARPRRIEWSNDGARLLLLARPGGLLVWDVANGRPIVHDPAIGAASLGPRGLWMVVADEGGRDVTARWLP